MKEETGFAGEMSGPKALHWKQNFSNARKRAFMPQVPVIE
jgi:hypothetical protein